MFSDTVPENSAGSWKTTPMVRRSEPGSPNMSTPLLPILRFDGGGDQLVAGLPLNWSVYELESHT